MTDARSLDLIAAANPFAALLDLPSCMDAHERLARLPQQAHRPMDRPTPIKDAGRPPDDAKPLDRIVVAKEVGHRDDHPAPRFDARDTGDIILVSHRELVG